MLLLHPSLKDGVKSPAHDDPDAQITDLPISAARTDHILWRGPERTLLVIGRHRVIDEAGLDQRHLDATRVQTLAQTGQKDLERTLGGAVGEVGIALLTRRPTLGHHPHSPPAQAPG